MGAPNQRVRAAQAVGICPCGRVLDDDAGVEIDVAPARHAALRLACPSWGAPRQGRTTPLKAAQATLS